MNKKNWSFIFMCTAIYLWHNFTNIMKKIFQIIVLLCISLGAANVYGQHADLKVVIIRHGEKPESGDNLTCKGWNRSVQLPAVLYSKIGKADYVYVPSMAMEERTKHSRMFQTVMPYAIKYNLRINSSHQEKDFAQIAQDIKSKTGIVLVVWEHKAIAGLVAALGVDKTMVWADDDFDSIWTITFSGDKINVTKDKENIHPKDDCTF